MKLPSITEYLSPREVAAIEKLATHQPRPVVEDEQVVEPDWGRRARIVGSGLLGMSLGTLGSFGALHAIDQYKRRNGGPGLQIPVPLSVAVPVLGGLAGLTYSAWKAKELEELKRAVKPRPDDKPAGG